MDHVWWVNNGCPIIDADKINEGMPDDNDERLNDNQKRVIIGFEHWY